MGLKKPRALVIGGSVAGVSCAHALLSAGWDVLVVEKSSAPPSRNPTGAGLGVDPQSCRVIELWLPQPEALYHSTLPLTVDLNQVTDREKKLRRILTRDGNFNFRAAYWTDFHDLLYQALPPDIFLWGHQFLSLHTAPKMCPVTVEARDLKSDKIVELVGDLLIAADGCMSTIRQNFLPDLELRYAGYSAWRGVLDFSGNEDSETITGIREAYPELGKCLYFDISQGSHFVLYELHNKRMNWIWYRNQQEPELKSNSVTIKVSNDMIQKMHEDAEITWASELVKVIKETKDPFLNAIYDCEPLQQLFWGRVVLIGDAAHPTTPHGLRSTNMSIADSCVLGECLKKWGLQNMDSALKEYQSIRLPVVSKQVLHSRRLGRIKQGLPLDDGMTFRPESATPEECEELEQRKMPFFGQAPSITASC